MAQLEAMGWTHVPGVELDTLDAAVPLLVDQLGPALRRRPRRVGRRWSTGTAGPAGTGRDSGFSPGRPVWFQLPMHLIDYVIAHELAHVKVSGHREDFWRLLRTALPEYEERRADLDELGRRLWMGDVR
ncbi:MULTISPECIES: M48 metallopeptidase family protein [Streptomyces]|uniref:M48 family metallopeptidase n=1 Tax=Streptomyces edwardsiae TaxID=3075527 RepID=A0ABU2QIW3_9ACTN|nr:MULTISPECIES: M48 family metallopeptidase [unclassified Streptomyces]MDT0403819.1 M48 family metallopeptidase [Streptomyces sp. DSM 41635]